MEQKPLKTITDGKWFIDKEKDIFIECYVTENKRRVLSLRGTARTMGLKGAGSTALVRNLSSSWVAPYLSDQLKTWLKQAQTEDLEYCVGPRGRRFIPFDAELFVDVCNVYIQAKNDGLFEGAQWINHKIIADKLLHIMSAFAKIGIIALIDEITGYQAERDRDELQKLLSLYLSEERLKWAKMFPDEYYRQLFRLKGWTYNPIDTKKPKAVGKLTNKLVYEKLPPGVLEKLRELNPVKNKKTWRREATHHQHLSVDIGQEDLRNHLLQLIAIMRVSPNWRVFERNFARAFPSPYGEQLRLDIDDAE